jgi:hypothetical protein
MLLAFLALAAAPPPHCAPVDLALAEKRMPPTFRGKPFRETSANFAKAYAKACAQGLLKTKPLAMSGRLFLVNAPDANVASIYSLDGRTVLEFSFVAGGKVNVPSVGDLQEAIYCAVHGASATEQEESGRCLPD